MQATATTRHLLHTNAAQRLKPGPELARAYSAQAQAVLRRMGCADHRTATTVLRRYKHQAQVRRRRMEQQA